MDARMRASTFVSSLHRFVGLLTLVVMISSHAYADDIPSEIDYSTTGWVSTGMSQTPLQFIGVQGGKTDGSAPFSLGSFTINAQQGVSTTYDHSPFVISLNAPAYWNMDPGDASHLGTIYLGGFTISGFVDGVISADGTAHVIATFNPQVTGPVDRDMFLDIPYANGLPFPLSDVKIPQTLDLWVEPALDIPGAKITDMPVDVMATIVPEPGGIAIFLAGIAAVGLRARWKRSSARLTSAA